MGKKEIVQKGKYWCNKCNRMHSKGRGKIFHTHLEHAREVSDYELRTLQFKRHWNELSKEQAKYGAVNLPKREKKRSHKYSNK